MCSAILVLSALPSSSVSLFPFHPRTVPVQQREEGIIGGYAMQLDVSIEAPRQAPPSFSLDLGERRDLGEVQGDDKSCT